MTAHADILDQRDSLKGAFLAALALHLAVLVGGAVWGLLHGPRETFGAPDAGGGAIGIEAVRSIPLPRRGPDNPLASDTQSQVPQTPLRTKEPTRPRPKESPDAIALKDRSRKKLAPMAAERQKFRPFEELDPNQLTSPRAPQLASSMYSLAGTGRVGAGPNTTLGNRFPAYADLIQRLVAQKWRTGEIDSRVQSGPVVIATFDLLRTGRVRNLQLLQASGIPTLDLSVQRAILEAAPFPPIPAGFERESAKVEFWFEFKR
jgi:protein TonB